MAKHYKANLLLELRTHIVLGELDKHITCLLNLVRYQRNVTVVLMSRSRREKIVSFKDFYSNAKNLFQSYAASDPRSKWPDDYFSLCITPGGRHGGLDNTLVEVFFGNRPVDSEKKLDKNLQITDTLIVAWGATLSYQRVIDGSTICLLQPASSEKQHPEEDFIVLEKISDPDRLVKISRKHWRYFIAYMQVTCIDGSPTFWERCLVSYLRNFKSYVSNKTSRNSRAFDVTKEIMKYVLTVGLSGFLLLAISFLKERSGATESEIYKQKMITTIDRATKDIEIISNSMNNIKSQIENITSEIKNSAATLDSINSNTRPGPTATENSKE